MTNLERALIPALTPLVLSDYEKGFLREMTFFADNRPLRLLTTKQAAYLLSVARRYQKGLPEELAQQLPQPTPAKR